MRQSTSNIRQRSTLVAAMALALIGGSASAEDICGDIDGDDDVDKSDLGLLLDDIGCLGSDCVGDLDGDADTDLHDLAWLLINLWCPGEVDCLECVLRGRGTIDLDLVAVDNTTVGAGDDPYSPDFHGGVTHFTFDLIAEITGMNDWTTQASTLELIGENLSLFVHEYGGDSEPLDVIIELFPALAYHTFYAGPPELFNAGNPDPGFAYLAPDTPTTRSAVWFNVIREGEATSTVQRFTIVAERDNGIVPTAVNNDCMHAYAVLARIVTSATSAATGANLLHRSYLIVDLAQPSCPGDVDMDGDVDQSDLGLLLLTYERPSDDALYDTRADFDCDDDVDQRDLGVLLAAYGGDC